MQLSFTHQFRNHWNIVLFNHHFFFIAQPSFLVRSVFFFFWILWKRFIDESKILNEKMLMMVDGFFSVQNICALCYPTHSHTFKNHHVSLVLFLLSINPNAHTHAHPGTLTHTSQFRCINCINGLCDMLYEYYQQF